MFLAGWLLALAALPPAPSQGSTMAQVLCGAYRQVGTTLYYDGRYRRIAFPGGDVPIERGVCADVIVRAYRHAGIDLQLLVHQDMTRAFEEYPRRWGLSGPDPNIDHRRVLNLAVFLARHGRTLAVSPRPEDYRPGDIVTWRLPSGTPHIGLISDRAEQGRPLVVHHLSAGVKVEDVLFSYVITGHYRYDPRGGHPPEAGARRHGRRQALREYGTEISWLAAAQFGINCGRYGLRELHRARPPGAPRGRDARRMSLA
jgi:uncharacterized protein YijF (DUF1287 family)